MNRPGPGERVAPIVEVLGPPGSGKTALLDELGRRDSGRPVSRIEVVSGYRNLAEIPAYLRAAVSLAPVLAAEVVSGRLSRRQLHWAIRVEASPHVANRRGAGSRVVIFDQGPLYTLARLTDSTRPADSGVTATSGLGRSEALARWRRGALDRWASALGVAVLLDAPDDVLVRRIHAREKPHAAKELPADAAVHAVASSRASLEAVLVELASRGGGGSGPQVLRFDSSHRTVGEIAASVTTALRGSADLRANVASSGEART